MTHEFHFSPRPNRAAEIAWRSWSPETFEQAQSLQRPILLSISAVWCHWCHVMDETSYSDPQVISYINEHYIPVRVDNDQRPDINARYNMGGWPTTAFLSPHGVTLTGATYVPPGDMLRTLQNVRTFFDENKARIPERSTDSKVQLVPADNLNVSVLRPSMITRIVEEIRDGYDDQYGGFGSEPKFPQTDVLELLLSEYQITKEQPIYDMLAKTIRAMSRGGMYDHVEGGFFRYSTTRDWSVPHFEKMTEDHAGLLRVLAGLYKVSNSADYRSTLLSATQYIRATLRDPRTNMYAGSQDADEEYFSLPLEQRQQRPAPYVDRTSYSNWTASLAGALCAVGDVLVDDTIMNEATAALDALDARMKDENGLLYHYLQPGGTPQVRGLLTDQASYLRALLDAHEYTGESRFLVRAEMVTDAILRTFSSPEGGFYDHANADGALGNLAVANRPLNDNGLLADSLLRLALICEQTRYRDTAEKTLLAFARSYGKAGSFAATYVRALRRYLTPSCTVRLIGTIDELRELRDTSLNLPDPLRVLHTIEPSNATVVERLGFAVTKTPVAYICAGATCAAPAYSPPEIRSAYDSLR